MRKPNDHGERYEGQVIKSFKRDGLWVKVYDMPENEIYFVPDDYYNLEAVADYLSDVHEKSLDDFEILPGYWD